MGTGQLGHLPTKRVPGSGPHKYRSSELETPGLSWLFPHSGIPGFGRSSELSHSRLRVGVSAVSPVGPMLSLWHSRMDRALAMGSAFNQVKGKDSRSVGGFTQPVETLLSAPGQPFFWVPNPPLP